MMSSAHNFVFRLAASLVLIIFSSLCWIFPAVAITQKLEMNSVTGYTIKTTFSYDEQSLVTISERGTGTTNALNSLTVSFYDPSGSMIASYDNIVDGVGQSDYLEFNYDPATRQLLGKIDFGGESAGEIYLKGEIDRELSLIKVEASGEERALDRVVSSK
ncbi:MAG TPA: hypothetical protein V6C71_09835 [Coleofasciculaceae cyanobacterium]